MTQKMKKGISFVIALAVFIGIGYGFVTLHYQKELWHGKAGYYNLSNWNQLVIVAETIDRRGYTVETLKEQYPYANSATQLYLSPPLNGGDTIEPFWGICYVPFMQALISDSLSKEQQKEGMKLFETMNQELISLCNSFLSPDYTARCQLVDSESEFYQATQEKIKEFCSGYAAKIRPFTQKLDR